MCKDKIVKNSGLRFITKLMLNSLWGKLAQSSNQVQAELVLSRDRLKELSNDKRIEFISEYQVDEASLLISYKFNNEMDAPQPLTSPAVAAFVTCWGRLKLYSLIEEIESSRRGRVLYCDTDSVIYVAREGEPTLITGKFLGELTDEFGEGQMCREAVFLGPKCYALQVIDPCGGVTSIKKVKGITFDSSVEDIVDFEQLKSLIRNKETVLVPQHIFYSSKENQVIYSKESHKKLTCTSDKRVFDNGYSRPFGFCLINTA